MGTSDAAIDTEVLVIGAGPGGYVAAIRAGQLGHDVTIVDREAWGGVCLNHGCIPSKALITATGLAHEAATADELGIDTTVDVDFGRMVAWKDGVVDRLTTGVERLCKANGVDLLEGHARFDGERRATVSTGDAEVAVGFEKAVIATGSRPIEVPGFSFDDEPVLDSRAALALEAVPDTLVVVGAGYIGMELATVFAKLGTDVSVVEMLESALPLCDDALTRPVMKVARDLGIEFGFGEAASDWRHEGDGIVVRTETADGETAEYAGDRVLVAVGRRPVTGTVSLEAIGLEPDDDGFIGTDDRMETDVDGVYAIGDVAGEPLLAHKASAQGLVAAAAIAGQDRRFDATTVPSAIFTDPEIGMVGATPAEAGEGGTDPLVGEFPFRASGRALTTSNADGFVRVVAEPGSGTIVGAQVVGPEASELVGELGLAVANGLTLEQVATTVHTHPTLAEAVMEAAENALGSAIHTLNR